MQPVDLTTLCAVVADLQTHWLPARLEQVYQCDRTTIALSLRTLERRGWLTVSWHPQAARVCIGAAPPKGPDTFTFSDQLRHQLKGLALIAIDVLTPWERVLDFQFARRPQDPVQWHLIVEVINKYSNVVLTNAQQRIVTVAHQVGEKQSRVRSLQTGQPYTPPPALTEPIPMRAESLDHWRDRIALIPGPLSRMLRSSYRGLSSALTTAMVEAADLSPHTPTEQLTAADWARLYQCWQTWLTALETRTFSPGWQVQGYTVLEWGIIRPVPDVHTLLDQYYTEQLNQQTFKQLRHQLQQKVTSALQKLHTKAEAFKQQLANADQADHYREQADLLMAYPTAWQPGMTEITLADFQTGDPRQIPLDPERNGIQNAQAFYKRHQKLKRTRDRVDPLLADVQATIQYLEQVQVTIDQVEAYREGDDLRSLTEIRDELIDQGFWPAPTHAPPARSQPQFICHQSPSGWDCLVGRNNHQNDHLTFRLATDYDLWFHTQEIPGSHVLLRLEAGAVPEDVDVAYAAHLAAYYSRARHSHQVPVVYTQPKHVFKPKGTKPGMVIYQREQVVWGQPQLVKAILEESAPNDKT